jgi:putative ABC transport system permease protein
MSHILQDLRVGARQLARQSTFAIIAIVTLALGIGAATTCFSVLNAVALRPIPFTDPDRLVAIDLVGPGGSGRSPLSLTGFRALTETQGAFSSYVAYTNRTITAAAHESAERVQAGEVTGDIFSLLGRPVQMGRGIDAADAGARVVVIGNDLWVRGFASDPQAVGRAMFVDGDQYVVVGVARPRFSFPQDSRVWLPMAGAAGNQAVDVVARLEAGVSAAQADAALRATSGEIIAGPAASERAGWIAATTPLRRMMIGTKQRDMALFILTASGLVLLIACANLAGLLTAYLSGRRHELALRAAVGASRWRLVQQLMTESLMLAFAGGALGVLLAQWGVAVFAATLGKPRGADWVELTVDGRVLLFALLAATVTAVFFGLAPAIAGSRTDLRSVLQEDRTTAGSRPGGRRTRAILVAGQIAVSIGLISGAAAIVTSSMRFAAIDPGFRRERLLMLKVALAGRAYEHPEERLAFVDAALERLRTLPGVASASAASHIPLADRDLPGAGFILDGAAASGRPPWASVRFVDANYLATMGIPLRRGRAFTAAEARDSSGRTIIVNDTMARRHWPDGDAVGRRLRLTGSPDVEGWYTVIGVVSDVAQRQLPATPENQVYLPLAPARELSLVVRAASDPAVIAASAREAVRGIDSSLSVDVQTMDTAYGFYARDRGLQGLVLGAIGCTAVLVATLGIYGIVSLMVSERRRELAIRIALGASRSTVMRLVLARGLQLASAGIVAGLLVAIPLTVFLSSVFLGVRPFDAIVLAAAGALLGGVALAASWWPARRAMRLDPMVALKQ